MTDSLAFGTRDGVEAEGAQSLFATDKRLRTLAVACECGETGAQRWHGCRGNGSREHFAIVATISSLAFQPVARGSRIAPAPK